MTPIYISVFNRLRWLRKLHDVRLSVKLHGRRTNRWATLLFVLWSPELHSHTFRLKNKLAVAEQVATFLQASNADTLMLHEEFRLFETGRRLTRKSLVYFPVLGLRPPLDRCFPVYCLVRLWKPSVVIELGVHHGVLGMCIEYALVMNGGGVYEGVDTNPRAGWLLKGKVHIADGSDHLARRAGSNERTLALLMHDPRQCDDSLKATLAFCQGDLLVGLPRSWASTISSPHATRRSKFGEITAETDHPLYPQYSLEFVIFGAA